MKRAIALAFVSTLVLAGCGRTVVKETVVERPVPQGTTVVQGPAPQAPTVVNNPAASGSTSASCVYESKTFSHGSMSCQDKLEFRCDNGTWSRTQSASC